MLKIREGLQMRPSVQRLMPLSPSSNTWQEEGRREEWGGEEKEGKCAWEGRESDFRNGSRMDAADG